MDNLREFVNKVLILQAQYEELYSNYDELVAISNDYVHLDPKGFMEVAQEYHLKPTIIRRRDADDYPLEAQIYVDDVLFITVGTFEDFRGLGLI